MNQNQTGDYNPLNQSQATSQSQNYTQPQFGTQQTYSQNGMTQKQPLAAQRAQTSSSAMTESKSKKVPIILGLLTIAAFSGIGWVAYESGLKSSSNNLPVVEAESTTIKIKPENPEGKMVPNQDKKVYTQIEKTPADQKPEPYDFSKKVAVAETPMATAITPTKEEASMHEQEEVSAQEKTEPETFKAVPTANKTEIIKAPPKTEIIEKIQKVEEIITHKEDMPTTQAELPAKQVEIEKTEAPKAPALTQTTLAASTLSNNAPTTDAPTKQLEEPKGVAAATTAPVKQPEKPTVVTAVNTINSSPASQEKTEIPSTTQARAFSFSSYTKQAETISPSATASKSTITSTSTNTDEPAATMAESAPSTPTQQASLSSSIEGNFLIQIGAVKSDVAAHSEWQKMSQKFPAQLGNMQLFTERVEVNGSTLYRVRGGMMNKSQAMNVCNHLKENNIPCFVVKK